MIAGRDRCTHPDMETSDRVLELLHSAPDGVSGSSMARVLGVSRTAVWKAVQKLIRQGHAVHSQPRRGYRLVRNADLLSPALIREVLQTRIVGTQVHWFDTVDSTNRIGKELAGRGAPDGTVILAEHQTRGRGRLEREWLSPRGVNLLFSLVFRPPLAPYQVFRLNMAAAVSLVEAVQDLTALQSRIKWPNDVFSRNRKLAGILTECSFTGETVDFAVVGIGLNVNMHPDEINGLAGIATSLSAELGRPVPRRLLFVEILRRMDAWYTALLEGRETELVDLWNRYSMIIGRQVEVISFDQAIRGKALTIDRDGALILIDAEGRNHRIVCGDVSLRPLEL